MASGRHEDSVYRPGHNVPIKLAPRPQRPLPSLAPSHKPARRKNNETSRLRRCLKCIYNKETNEIFWRTPCSWLMILSYSTMYLLFLLTFTLTVLYISLVIIKRMVDFNSADSTTFQYLRYSEHSIGLTATPTSENSVPLIWYKKGEKDGYNKYVRAIDKFLSRTRRNRDAISLGPCGQSPYGYGEKPCVIVKINKRFNWAGQPLRFNSTIANSAPAEVQEWMRVDKNKLWLHCTGLHSYDKEHIGRINYYPDPPGFDASMFPLDVDKMSPLIAIQVSEFTIGIALAIQCTLWYESVPSIIVFVLYVAPGERISNTTSVNQ